MALITDPDFLNQSTEGSAGTPDGEIFINPATKTIELIQFGNMSEDGATLKAIYSFLKEEWRTDPELIKYDFPMTPITDESMQIGISSRNNGWVWLNSGTRELIRTGGWQEITDAGALSVEYAGIVSLGTLTAGTQPYYQQESGGSPTNFVLEGVVNQAVLTYDSVGPVDYRSFFKILAREQGDIYAQSELSEIGVSAMTFQVYRFPLGTTEDIKITTADIAIDSAENGVPDVAPYSGMSITYYAAPQSRLIGSSNYNFGIIIDGNNATAEQIYEFVQFSLRQSLDIDSGAGTVIGQTADPLLQFIGDSLRSRNSTNPAGGGTGVYIDNFQTADINRISFFDNTSIERSFPFTANLILNLSLTLQNDTSSIYRVFFTNDDAGDNSGYDFGTSNAIIPHTNVSHSTTNRLRSTNEATITIGTHSILVGDVVEVSGLGGTGYNGVFVVTAVAATTITYDNTETDEGSTADTDGTVYVSMGGLVDGNTSIQLGYDYDTNVQRGTGSDETEAPVTAVAIGLDGAQYVLATGSIARSTANAIALVAPIERNYENL